MCAVKSGLPQSTEKLLEAGGPLVLYRASESRLRRPPSRREVIQATEKFAPKYDEWMRETHYPKAIEMLRGYWVDGHARCPIAEIGCGTAMLISNLILSMAPSAIIEIASETAPGHDAPLTFLCIDQSDLMLDLARANIGASLQRLIDMRPMAYPELGAKDFRVDTARDGSSMRLLLGESEVLRTIFSAKDARDMVGTGDQSGIQTIILSYVMHWVRGMREKDAVARTMFDILPSGGTLLSVEEYPLVVRCDQHPGNEEIMDLARSIAMATTPLTIRDIRELFKRARFEIIPQTNPRKPIDDIHDMYGQAYVKP